MTCYTITIFDTYLLSNYHQTNIDHHILLFSGDAFLGRCHDDESMSWGRLSITADEATADAPWVIECASDNRG